jgi:hypothetical protein
VYLEKVRQEEERARELERKQADKRARALLLQLLNPEQRAQFLADEHFVVPSPRDRHRRYRIRRGRVGNIDVVSANGCVSKRLCVHPQEHVPDYDVMAAQLLMIRADEEMLLSRANVHDSLTPRQQVLPALH